MKTKRIPATALQFAAAIEVKSDKSTELKPVPVTLRARSADVVEHWFWGRTVHDFAGMTTAAERLPLDYNHRVDEIVGYSDKQDISTGELVMSGFLTPFTATDRASEIISKAKNGVPWQASIAFDDATVVIEEVAEGMKATVNGKELEGPLTIFREWRLRGCAVCPHGMDANTSTKVQFAAKQPQVFVSLAPPKVAINGMSAGLSKFAANIRMPA